MVSESNNESNRPEEPQEQPITGIFWDLSYAAHMSDCWVVTFKVTRMMTGEVTL